MKTLKYLLCVLALASATLSFTGCELPGMNDDTEEPGGGGGGGEGGGEIPGDIEVGWSEEGDKLIFRDGDTCVYTFTFEGDTCSKAELVYYFDDAVTAQYFAAAMKQNASFVSVTQSGKTVKLDCTGLFGGLSKKQLMDAIDASEGWL